MFGSVIMKSVVLNSCPNKCIQIILQLHGHCTYSNSLYFRINFGWMIWKFISDLRKLYVHRTRQIFWSNISTWQSHKHVVSIYFWNIWFPLIAPVSSVLLTRNPVSEILLSFCTRIYVLHEKGTAVHSRADWQEVLIHLVEFSGLLVKQIRTLELVSIFIFRR